MKVAVVALPKLTIELTIEKKTMNQNKERYIKHCQDCDEKLKQNPQLETEICHDCRGTTIKSKMIKSRKDYYCPPCSQFIDDLERQNKLKKRNEMQ